VGIENDLNRTHRIPGICFVDEVDVVWIGKDSVGTVDVKALSGTVVLLDNVADA